METAHGEKLDYFVLILHQVQRVEGCLPDRALRGNFSVKGFKRFVHNLIAKCQPQSNPTSVQPSHVGVN